MYMCSHERADKEQRSEAAYRMRGFSSVREAWVQGAEEWDVRYRLRDFTSVREAWVHEAEELGDVQDESFPQCTRER